MKKKLLLFMIALGAIVFFTGCSDDEKKASSPSLTGTWDVTDAAGVEWEENVGNTGAGTVINTTDPDPEFIGETFIFTADEITFATLGTFEYDFTDGVISIDVGGGDIEVWNVEFDGSDTMYWTQDEPNEHSDYEYNAGGENYLFYQKSFTLELQ
jgi:hypothetical protein